MTPNELTPDLAAFIEAQTSIFLATASANGQPHIQHRGPPRFLRVLDRVLDDKTPGGDRGSQRLRSSIWCWRDHSAGKSVRRVTPIL
jgi:hypothetical protein